MTIAVDLGLKATKQTNKSTLLSFLQIQTAWHPLVLEVGEMVTMATKRQGHSLNLLMNNMSCLVNQDTSSSWDTSQRDILLESWPSLASVSLLVHTGPEKNECLNMIITLCIYLNICIGCSKEPSPCYLEFKNQGIFNEKRAFFFKFLYFLFLSIIL